MDQNEIIEKAMRQCDKDYSPYAYAWSETGYKAMADDLAKELRKNNYRITKIIPYEDEK